MEFRRVFLENPDAVKLKGGNYGFFCHIVFAKHVSELRFDARLLDFNGKGNVPEGEQPQKVFQLGDLIDVPLLC